MPHGRTLHLLYIFCPLSPFGGVSADSHGCQTSAIPLSTPSCLCKSMFVRPKESPRPAMSHHRVHSNSSTAVCQKTNHTGNKNLPWDSPEMTRSGDTALIFSHHLQHSLCCFSPWHLSSPCILCISLCCLLSVSP